MGPVETIEHFGYKINIEFDEDSEYGKNKYQERLVEYKAA